MRVIIYILMHLFAFTFLFVVVGSGLRYHFPVTYRRDVWPSYCWAYDLVTCPRAALARLLCRLWTRWIIRVIVSHATRENSQTCRPRAVIGRQRLSLRSSRQWARTAQLSPGRGRVTDRAPTTTVRALRRPSGLWETSSGPRTTPTGEDAEAAGSERRDGSKRRGSSVQLGRRTTCPSTPPLSRWSNRRANSLSAKSPTPTRKHSALLAVLRLLLRSWWLLFTALHVMQTRYSEENSVRLSVRLSVSPSVCHTRDPWQNGREICPYFYTTRKNIYPSFLRRRMVGGGRPLLPEILGQPTPVGAKSPIFNQ